MPQTTPGPCPLSIRDFVTRPVITVAADDPAETAYQVLDQHQISAVLVVGRDGVPAGVLSRRDLLEVGRVLARGRGSSAMLELPVQAVGDLMTYPVVTVDISATVGEAARLLVERRIHRVFVIGGDELAVFSTRDAMEATRVARLGAPIASVMSTRVLAIDRTAQLAQGISLLEDEAVTGVVVTDDGLPIGVFGQAQAIAARDLPADTPIEDHLDHSLLLLPARTPLFRAAAFSQSTSARRIVAVGANHQMVGVVTGLDFCRALAGGPVEPIRGVLPGARA